MIDWLARIGLPLLFPERCLGCREIIAPRTLFCDTCHASFPWIPEAHCTRCALPFTSPLAGVHECSECLTETRSFGRVFALGLYRGLLLNLIVRMKYHHEEPVAWRLGELLAGQVRDKAYDLVVPVPLHVTRLRKRGYNQSAWLAKSLAKQEGLAWDPFVLRKVGLTPVQTGLPRGERLKNVRNSFAVDSDQVTGKRILLVDDVYTTGATLEACARVLKKAGAKEVDTSVIARTA